MNLGSRMTSASLNYSIGHRVISQRVFESGVVMDDTLLVLRRCVKNQVALSVKLPMTSIVAND